MIVQPDFADHWKTRLLVRQCGHEAVLCLIRFWSHCQNRKKWVFEDLTPAVLASICAWSGDEKLFWDAMTQTFLDAEGSCVSAHEWAEINHRLIHNWEAGPKGGRPKTQGLSQGVTQGVTDGVDGVDGVDREDKIDKKEGVQHEVDSDFIAQQQVVSFLV